MQEESPALHNYVYSSEMVELVTISNAYCRFLSTFNSEEGRIFIEQSVKLLAGVYASLVRLGNTDPVFDSPGEPTVTEQEWSSVYQRIAAVIREHNEFLRPAEEDEFDRSDLVTHTISEDMTDVYQELKDFTAIYSRGLEEQMNDAAWELKERFTEHWGKKLLRSLIALHELLIKGIDPTEKK